MNQMRRTGIRRIALSVAAAISTFLFALISASQAEVLNPARNIQQIDSNAPEETVVNVKTARVLVADYALLRADFPEVRGFSNEQIDQWLLNTAGKIAISQAKQEVVNSPIQHDDSPDHAYRPRGYGRGLIFKTPGGGLIDAKGSGAVAPSPGHHSDGLATTGESLREYAVEKMVSKTLKKAGSKTDTLGCYAVIDWGFEVKHEDGSTSPAGSVLRQAEKRETLMLTNHDIKAAFELESTLRHFGITTAGDKRGVSWEALNIQNGKSRSLIDFGAYLIVDHFQASAIPYDISKNELKSETGISAFTVLDPKDPTFPQPDPKHRIPMSEWGADHRMDPKSDQIWRTAHELADGFRHGHLSRHDVESQINGLLDHVDIALNGSTFNSASIDKTRFVSPIARINRLFKNGQIESREAVNLLLTADHYGFILPGDLEPLTELAANHNQLVVNWSLEILFKLLPGKWDEIKHSLSVVVKNSANPTIVEKLLTSMHEAEITVQGLKSADPKTQKESIEKSLQILDSDKSTDLDKKIMRYWDKEVVASIFGLEDSHVTSDISSLLDKNPDLSALVHEYAKNPKYRKSAISVLRTKKTPTLEDLRTVLHYLTDHSPEIQEEAFRSLEFFRASDPPEADATVTQGLLKSTDSNFTRLASHYLSDQAGPMDDKSKDQLFDKALKLNSEDRMSILSAFAFKSKPHDLEMTHKLMHWYSQEADVGVRQSLLTNLFNIERANSELHAFLLSLYQKGDLPVRMNAAAAMIKNFPSERAHYLPSLIISLDNSDPTVRRIGVSLLSRALPTDIAILQKVTLLLNDSDERVRFSTIRALSRNPRIKALLPIPDTHYSIAKSVQACKEMEARLIKVLHREQQVECIAHGISERL